MTVVRAGERRGPPTRAQIAATRAVVEWYLRTHFGAPDDPGMPSMFMRRDLVGSFAITPEEYANGRPTALFRLLVATSMFQRRQDQQILRILRRMPRAHAAELTSARGLLRLVDEAACPLVKTNDALIGRCDLDKSEGVGVCTRRPRTSCHLKRHTEWLRRYGHFGKVPTSIALAVRESGSRDLTALRSAIIASVAEPRARAVALEAALSAAWRVNQKIASMFLSMMSNPDLPPRTAPWSEDIDWTYFVIVDSNVDLFLDSIGYAGVGTYDARREFICDLAKLIDLSLLDRTLRPFNPRLVQQAAFLFMSKANRSSTAGDCMHVGPAACIRCPSQVRKRCAVQS